MTSTSSSGRGPARADASPPGGGLTLGGLLRGLVASLRAAGVDEPGAVAEFAVAARAGGGRLDPHLYPRRPVDPRVARRVREDGARLARHEPLAHVLGWTEFRGRRFLCDARALVPRPETEELVGLALADRAWERPPLRVADVGTGTGCIAITLALERPAARVTAVDASPGALALARANAAALGAARRVRFREGDLLGAFGPARFDLVVANLPYVPSAELRGLDRTVRDYEPRAALDGGADGLDLVRRLLPQAARCLRPRGRVYLELGEDQAPAVVSDLVRLGFRGTAASLDARGVERFVSAEKPAG